MSQIPMPPGGVPPLGPRLDVSVGDLSLTPGQTGIVAVLIRNLEFVARTYSLGLVGVDPEWVALPAAVGPLAPGASVAIEIPITLPNGFPACDYAAVLHFQPRDPVTGVAAGPAVAVNLALTIGDGSLISATLDPAEVRGRERGRFRVVLRNRSPSAMRIELSGVSAGDELRVRFAEPAIALMPGQEVQIKGAVHGHRPVFGQTRRRPFVVRVQGRSTPVLLDGSFTQRPVASSLVLKVAAVVLLIGAWALLAFFLLGRLSSSTNKKAVAKSATAPNPAAPADNGVTSGGGAGGAGGAAGGASGAGGAGGAGGAAGAPGSAKLTRVSGKVTAVDPSGILVTITPTPLVNEQSQARTATNAAFSTPIGKVSAQLVAATVTQAVGTSLSTTTNSDGSWAFAGVRGPGFFQVTFAKAGYQTRSYVITTGADGQPVQLAAAMQPASGAISGAINDSQGKPLGGVDVTITDGTISLVTRTPTTGPVGAWSVTGVSTPGTYLVTAKLAGYATQTSLVSVPAGGTVNGLTLTMTAGAGSISGTVKVLGVGTGGIVVSATNGTVTLTATTATAPPGAYILPNLAIPSTYTVTMSGPGLVTQTSQVALTAAGASLDGNLTPTTGTVQGRVGCTKNVPAGVAASTFGDNGDVCATNPDSPTPPLVLSGAGITLSNDQNTFKTVSTINGVYSLSNIPPGHYTLTGQAFEYGFQVGQVDISSGGPPVTADLSLNWLGKVDKSTGQATGHIADLAQPDAPPICTAAVPCHAIVDTNQVDLGVAFSTTHPGDYTISSLGAGLHNITAWAAGHEPVTVAASVALNGVGFAPPILLPRLLTLKGDVTSRGPSHFVPGPVATLYDAKGVTVPLCTAAATVVPTPCYTVGPTDVTGHYELDNITHGTYTVGFSKSAFIPDTVSATPPPKAPGVIFGVNQDQVVDFALDELPQVSVNAVTPGPDGTLAPVTPAVGIVLTGIGTGDVQGPTNAPTVFTGLKLNAQGQPDTYRITFTNPPPGSTLCIQPEGSGPPAAPCSVTGVINQELFVTVIFSPTPTGISGQLQWHESNQGGHAVPVPDSSHAKVTMTAVDSYVFPTPGGPGVAHKTTYTAFALGGVFSFPTTDTVLSPTADFTVQADGFQPFSQTGVSVGSGNPPTPFQLAPFELTPIPVGITGKVVLNPATEGQSLFSDVTVDVSFADGSFAPVSVSVDNSGNIIWIDQSLKTPGQALPVPDSAYRLTFHKPGYDPTGPVDVPVPLCGPTPTCSVVIPTVTLNRLATITATTTPPAVGATFTLRDHTGTVVQTLTATGTTGVTFTSVSVINTTYTVSVVAPGYAVPGGSGPVPGVTAGCACSVTLPLQPLGSIVGTLLLRSYVGGPTTPAKGVTISATPQQEVQPCAHPFTGITDANGMFLIIGDTTVACQGLRPGPYSITATVSGYQPLALDGPFQVTGLGTPFTGILTATPEDVSGTVTSGTSPVANVSVAATNQSTGEVTTTLTDASGNYTLRSLAPVNYTVSFTKATYAPLLNVALNLQPGMAPPRLNERITQYNNTLTGQTFAQFTSTLERPLPGVVVKLEDPTSRNVLRQTVSAQAGPTGPATYSIPNPTSDPAPLLDGTYLVVFDHVPGYNAPIPINVTMSGGNMYAADGVYTPLSHNVKVTVQSSVGPTALAGASVTLTPVAGGTGQAQGPQQTGFDGTTFFNQVIPGDYTIVVDGTTVGPVPHLSPPPTPLTVPFDDSTTTQMPPTVTINEMEITGVASVNDGTGAQGSGAVKVTINPGNVLPPVQSDGTYGVFLTPAGYDVGFSAPGYVATSQHVNSNSAKNTVSATLIPKKHSVTANVTSNVGGGPISGALVTLTPVAGGTGSPVPPKTTVAGTVIFTNVVPGDYTLAVDGTGIPIAPHATASQPFTLPIADADPAPVAVKVSEGLITGTVTNSSTTSPVPGVTVQVLDQNQQVVETATTLRDGTYKVYVTPGASFDVMFSMSGFNSQTKTNISVSDGQTISPPLNVSLVSN